MATAYQKMVIDKLRKMQKYKYFGQNEWEEKFLTDMYSELEIMGDNLKLSDNQFNKIRDIFSDWTVGDFDGDYDDFPDFGDN